MKKTKLQNVQSLEAVDSISIMSAMASGFLGSGDLGSGSVPYHNYPSGYQNFSFSVWPYGFGKGIGFTAKYDVRGNYIFKNLKLAIYAEVSKVARQDCTYVGGVVVKKNGKEFSSCSLAPLTGSYVIDANWNPIGKAEVSVPSRGRVRIELITGQNFDTGVGIVPTSHTEVLYDK